MSRMSKEREAALRSTGIGPEELAEELGNELDAVRADLAASERSNEFLREETISVAHRLGLKLESVRAERDALLKAAKDVVAQRFGMATAKECGALDGLKRAIQAAEREVKS